MCADPKSYGPIVHEQRLAHEAEQAALEGRQRFSLGSWEGRTQAQRDLDERIGAAVAAQAIADAKLRNERLEAQLFALGAYRAVILRALRMAASDDLHAERMADLGRDRAALTALGGGDDQERTDEKGLEP
jgi:hypothetical protein